ncbi:hypothetical protein [Cupriavidus alkaliphilus]|uniref:hypothetical protein n=1 Tax=Cupriavidus alkaliphilus TaxID=942866 RepID=UPI00339D768F
MKAVTNLRRRPSDGTIMRRILASHGIAGPGRLTEREMRVVYADVVAKLRRRRWEAKVFSLSVFLFRKPGRVIAVAYDSKSSNAGAEWEREPTLRHWLGNYSEASDNSHVLGDVVGFNDGR